MSAHVIGAGLALAASWFYGSADFYAGVASRRITTYQVMVITGAIGVLVMAGLGILWGEDWPTPTMMGWAAAGGVVGSLGLIALCRGLVSGNAAVVSPISGVIGAAIPVVVATGTVGLPEPLRMAGFAVACPGIWMVTLSPTAGRKGPNDGFVLGLLAGIGFGLYFVCLAQIGPRAVFGPLAVVKASAGLFALLLVAAMRVRLPSFKDNPAAVLSGLLDPGANALFLVSTGYARLDVAAVLASLYPMGTVLLSRLVFKEPIARFQWAGVGLCLIAIALITL